MSYWGLLSFLSFFSFSFVLFLWRGGRVWLYIFSTKHFERMNMWLKPHPTRPPTSIKVSQGSFGIKHLTLGKTAIALLQLIRWFCFSFFFFKCEFSLIDIGIYDRIVSDILAIKNKSYFTVMQTWRKCTCRAGKMVQEIKALSPNLMT